MSWKEVVGRMILINICLIIINGMIGQSRWTKVFYEEKDAVGNTFINSYDKGILLAGKHGSNYVDYNWLIKTDINGEILWEKTIGASGTTIKISDMAYNQQGELYLVGLTGYYNENDYDPLIMKLNSCEEKEWCKVFIEADLNFSNEVVATPDGGCASVLRYMNPDLQKDRICLVKLDSNGEIQWNQCYNSQDTNIYNEEAQDLIMTPDNGFLISGYCDYADPNPPHYWWPKPYYIKADSNGNFEWEVIVHKEVSDIGGFAWTTSIDPYSNNYYSSISHYFFDTHSLSASMLKMNEQGNIVDIVDITPPNYFGTLYEAKFITDSTLAASAVWGSDERPKAVIIDTLGNLLKQTNLLDNDEMAYVQVTFDKKLLFFTNIHDENYKFDAYLFKLNQNLESDTVYTQYFTYDSLCDSEIVSDTIVQDDCGIIVGDVEISKPKDEIGIVIYPNPATSKFTVESPLFKAGNCRIEIYNIQGMKTETAEVKKGEPVKVISTRGWEKGMYIVRILGSRGEIINRKVIVY